MIGKTIKSILTTNSALIALVPAVKIYPYVMNEDTQAPCIVFTIDSLEPEYTKSGWADDTITFSVYSYAVNYNSLQTIAKAVRTALELNKTGSGTESINHIYLQGMEEGYVLEADTFFNKLTFRVKTNNY